MITQKEYDEISENLQYSLLIKLITIDEYNKLHKEHFNINHKNGYFTGENK